MQHLTEENHSITYPSENLPIKKRLDNSWMTISMVQNFWCYWSLKRVYFQSYKLQLIQLHYWEKVYQDQHVNGAGSNLIAYILIQLSFFWNLSKKALFKKWTVLFGHLQTEQCVRVYYVCRTSFYQKRRTLPGKCRLVWWTKARKFFLVN